MRPSRRRILTTSPWLLGGPWLLGSAWAREERSAKRSSRERSFRLSLAAYSYRRLLTSSEGKEPELTLFDFVDDCASFGTHGTELTSYYFPENPSREYLSRLKGHCFRTGLDISGTAVGNDFGFPKGEERDRQLDSVKKWIEIASFLGAPVIRVFAGHPKNGMAEKDARRLMVDGLEECCQHAGDHGIHLALENHGGPTATVEGLLAFVEDVKSPWFGINLDTGNFRSNSPYRDLAKATPHAINVQVKVKTSTPDGSSAPTDFRKIGQILRDTDYRGYVVLEYEEESDPREVCRSYLERLEEEL